MIAIENIFLIEMRSDILIALNKCLVSPKNITWWDFRRAVFSTIELPIDDLFMTQVVVGVNYMGQKTIDKRQS